MCEYCEQRTGEMIKPVMEDERLSFNISVKGCNKDKSYADARLQIKILRLTPTHMLTLYVPGKIIEDLGEEIMLAEINFCPKCGRKLGGALEDYTK